MSNQVAEEVEKKLKNAGIKPSSDKIKDAVVAQVSGTQYHIISDIPVNNFIKYFIHAFDTTQEIKLKREALPRKIIDELFPAYFVFLDSVEKLPDDIDERQKRIINDKIEELYRTTKDITRSIREYVPVSDNITATKVPASKVQRNTNLDWLLTNPPELEHYRGRYVAIENAKVVGSGRTSGEALAEARKDNPKRKVLLKLVSDTDIGL
jgi:hypothetical protein